MFKYPPNQRVYSPKLVTRIGTSSGPRSATPRKPAVLVETPSIGLLPVSISSTYTPGERYSGMGPPFSLRTEREVLDHGPAASDHDGPPELAAAGAAGAQRDV